MSKKYIPSFLKDSQSNSIPTTSLTPFNSSNKFAALSDDFPMINTKLASKETPKLTPMTLASLTSNGTVSNVSSGGTKMSFAAKFAEQTRIAQNPNYVPPPKPVNLNSEDDFPSLGSSKKSTNSSLNNKPNNEVINSLKETSFAEKAKEWANKNAEDEKKAHAKALREERLRREAELIRSLPVIGFCRRYHQNNDDDSEEDDYNPNYDESSLGDDNYEVPEEDQEPSEEEDEDEDNEFNQNVGWDGRRRGDLY
jgi:hypothetical protein